MTGARGSTLALNRWRVVRRSTTTGRVLKVIRRGFDHPRDAELFCEGFGRDASPKTVVDWEREP